MQEFLASYAVKVDEDGARRLQSVLEQNRKTASALSSSFGAARSALADLKKDLSSSVGMKYVLASLTGGGDSGGAGLAGLGGLLGGAGSAGLAGLSGFSLSARTGGRGAGTASGGSSGRATLSLSADTKEADAVLSSFKTKAEAQKPRLSVETEGITSAVSSAVDAVRSMLSGVSVTVPVRAALEGAGDGGLAGLSGSAGLGGLSGGKATLPVTADTKAADEAVSSFRTKAESTKPRLSVNATGITSAVSSAIATVRSMLSGLSVTIPVRAVTSLDTSGVKKQAAASGLTVGRYAAGGRVASPTLAMIAEEGSPEYVIPVGDEARAVPLLRSLLGELSASARAQLFLSGAAAPSVSNSVQAPVNISVTSTAAPAEAVGRSIYDTAQRSLLRTLKGVFV